MQNPKDISNPTTALDMELELMAKAFQLNNTTPTNNNQRSSSNPCYSQIAQLGHLVGQNVVQNQGIQNVGNQNGLIVVLGIANQNPNGNCNVVAARSKGNTNRNNGNQIRFYNCRGLGHLASNCIVKPRKRDVAYLHTQLQIAQKEEAGIQLNSEEFDFMTVVGAYDEIEETDKAPVYDSDGSAEVHHLKICYDNDIFNMFTQEEQYTELLEPIPELYQVPQNDSNVISKVYSVEQSGGTVEQHPATTEETRTLYDSLYNNLAIEVKKANSFNRKLRETNVDLTTEHVRYKNQEKCFEISQEKYDKLERCYQKSVHQDQCLTKKINALHLSSGKKITALNEEISNLNNQLSKKKSIVSSLQEEKKRLKSDFKIREDELLDKQIQLENKIKELDNILVKMGQSVQTMHMLSPKPDSFYHTEQKMALGYQNPFYLKQAQQKQQSLYNGTVLLEKHDPPAVYDSRGTLDSSAKRVHKIVKDEIFPIVNQVDARVQNFEIQFLKEAAKFVRDFKSLAKEADEALAKHKALELEIERLLREVISQDIMSIVQNPYVVDTLNLQTKLDRMKERFENSYNDMQQKIERLQAQLGDLMGKSKDTLCVADTIDPLSQKLENENIELEFQVSERKDTIKGTSVNTQFCKQSILGNPPSFSRSKLYSVTPFPKYTVIPKVGELNALSKPVTSNSVPTPQDSKVVKMRNRLPLDCLELILVNDMNSRALNKKEHVSNVENQKKHKPKVGKLKKVGCKERLASPKTSTPRSCLRWSPTGRMFDLKGIIIATSESVCQSYCPKGDNACTYNPQEPISKQFPNSTFSMTGCQNWLDILLIQLISEYKPKDKETHGDNECDN
ncbi:hypothetical protein Tco_0083741 [Tanacetum coccineum]